MLSNQNDTDPSLAISCKSMSSIGQSIWQRIPVLPLVFILIILALSWQVIPANNKKSPKQTSSISAVSDYFTTYQEMLDMLKQNNKSKLAEIAIDLDAIQYPLRIKQQNPYSPVMHKEIAFTFDLGMKPGRLDYILDTLAKHKMKSTFFVTGHFLQKFPDHVRRIVNEGHEVGNHSFTHPKFKNAAHLKKELESTALLFYRVTGRKLAPYWRSPYFQVRTPFRRWQLAYAEKLGYPHFYANIYSHDWTPEGSQYFVTQKQFLYGFGGINLSRYPNRMAFSFSRRTIKQERDENGLDMRGAIVCMHADSHRRGNFLPHELDNVFTFLKSKGYTAVTLSELMNERDINAKQN